MKRYKNAMKPSSLRFFIQDNNNVSARTNDVYTQQQRCFGTQQRCFLKTIETIETILFMWFLFAPTI